MLPLAAYPAIAPSARASSLPPTPVHSPAAYRLATLVCYHALTAMAAFSILHPNNMANSILATSPNPQKRLWRCVSNLCQAHRCPMSRCLARKPTAVVWKHKQQYVNNNETIHSAASVDLVIHDYKEKGMKQQRWWGVIATLLLIVIAYADRVNISVMLVNPEFLHHFDLAGNRAYQGTLMTAFLLGYGLSAMLLTPLLETLFGYRKGLTLSVILWALFTAASPLVGSFIILLVVRAFLGVSEGPLFSLKTMYISDHFAANERGKPNAVSALGVSLGLVIGFPLVTFLMNHLGWALSFYVLALINLLVGLLLVRVFIHPRTTAVVQRSSAPLMKRVCHTFMLAWKTPMLGWIMLVEIATLSYLWGSSSWLPAYLTNERGFSINQMGWLASLPFIISIFSKYLGGVILDRVRPQQMPLIFAFGGAATAICMLGVMLSSQGGWLAMFLLAANACWGAQGAAIPTLIQYHAKAESVGSAYGLINGVGNLFSAFIPLLMGLVMMSYGTVSSGFSVLVASQVLTLFAGGMLFVRMQGNRQLTTAW
jgi:predicted MFS family arabinose efflux permease